MNTILRYGVIVGWGSLLGAASSWASQEQGVVQGEEGVASDSRPAFINIGKVQVPVDALPENILQALQDQQELMQLEMTNKDLEIRDLMKQNLGLKKEQKFMDELRETIQEKEAWISHQKYLDRECLQKCSSGEIVLIHGFAQQVDALKKQIYQLRIEKDILLDHQQQVSVEVSRMSNQIEPLRNQVEELERLAAHRQQTINSLQEENERLEEENEAVYRQLAERKVLT